MFRRISSLIPRGLVHGSFSVIAIARAKNRSRIGRRPMIENPESSYWIPGSPALRFGAQEYVPSGRSGHEAAATKVDAGGGEGTVRLLGGCGSRDGDARLELALVGDDL